MQLDSHVSDFRQAQLAVSEGKAGLSIGERIVSFMRTEAREACFLFALLNSAKEVLKSLVESAENVLQYLTMNLVKFWTNLFNFRQLVGLLNVTDRFSFKAVGVSPLLKSSVIEFAAKRKGLVQACSLRLARIDAKLKSTFCYFMVSHVQHAQSVSGLVKSQESWQATSDFVPHFSSSSRHRIHKRSLRQRGCGFIPRMNAAVFSEVLINIKGLG